MSGILEEDATARARLTARPLVPSYFTLISLKCLSLRWRP